MAYRGHPYCFLAQLSCSTAVLVQSVSCEQVLDIVMATLPLKENDMDPSKAYTEHRVGNIPPHPTPDEGRVAEQATMGQAWYLTWIQIQNPTYCKE